MAGRVSATYQPPGGSAADMGVSEQGWELEATPAFERVDECDKFGLSLCETIWRGYQNVFLNVIALEWLRAVLDAGFPFGAAYPVSGSGYLGSGVVGRLGSAIAGAVVLTATAATPAATMPASLTASYALASQQSLRFAMNSKLRRIPLQLQVYPYVESSLTKWVSAT